MKKEKFSKSDIKEILDKYDEVSVREGIADMTIHIEGKQLVRKRLKSFLSGRKIIGLEIKFGFWGKEGGRKIYSKFGVPLMGAIDKVEEYDDDTILIIDYKTSKTAPTSSEMKDDIQLSLYDIVARQLFPQYKRIILSLDLLKSSVLYTYRTDSQREEFESYLKVIYDQMKSFDESKAVATLNTFCPWCDYRDYCDKYLKACRKSDYTFLPTMNLSDEEIIKEWESVKVTKRILGEREQELNMVIMEKIKRSNANIVVGDKEIYVRQNSRRSFDIDKVVKVVPQEDFFNLVKLNNKAVKDYMEISPMAKEAISESLTVNYTAPFLSVRKATKKK